MGHGIIYLLTGPSHGVRLVVSLWSLRKHYGGPVTVYTTRPESHVIGDRCARERRLGVEHCTCAQVPVRKNSSFLTKVALLLRAPYEVTAYLDADTLVAGDISRLLELSEAEPFCATQFAAWQSTGRVMRRRIERWRGLLQDRYDPDWFGRLIDAALEPHPAVNGGVVACHRGATLLQPWYELAMVGWRTFICDEVALQILLHHYPHKLLDCRYNCSPIYASNQQDARVWHFHGEKHVGRAEAGPLWLPAYQECVREDVAGLAGWSPGHDGRLGEYLAGMRRTGPRRVGPPIPPS